MTRSHADRRDRSAARARPAVFEPLEGRQLMSASPLDPTFGGGRGFVETAVRADVQKTLVQTDGKIVVLATDGRVVRFTATGALDTTFAKGGADGDGVLSPIGYNDPTNYLPNRQTFGDIALTASNKLIVTGAQERASGRDQLLVARFKADGTKDPSFNGTGSIATMLRFGAADVERGNAVLVDAKGKVVVCDRAFVDQTGGYTTTIDTLVRFNRDGSRDAGFGNGGGFAQPLGTRAAQPFYDKNVLTQAADGTYAMTETWPGDSTVYVSRYDQQGRNYDIKRVELGFVGGNVSSSDVTTLSVLPDGGVLFGGSVTRDGLSAPFAAKLTRSLDLDYSFANGVQPTTANGERSGQVRRLVPLANGAILQGVTGGWDATGSLHVRTLGSNGVLPRGSDDSFPVNAPLDTGDVALLSSGKVLVVSSLNGKVVLFKMLSNVGAVHGTVKVGTAALPGVTVYADLNNDGSYDPSEGSTVTDENGNYRLVGISPGTVTIRQLVPDGYAQSTPGGSTPGHNAGLTVTVAANAATTGKNFVDVDASARIDGTVFNDLNLDGVRNNGEGGAEGLRVYLDANNNGRPDTNEWQTTTDAYGDYDLSGLVAGTYRVRVELPTGYAQTTPTNNAARLVTIVAGQQKLGVNFGTRLIGVR